MGLYPDDRSDFTHEVVSLLGAARDFDEAAFRVFLGPEISVLFIS